MMDENVRIREEILQSVNGLSDEQLNEKHSDDSWSIAQVLDHLVKMERIVTKLILAQVKSEGHEIVDDKPIHLTVDRRRKVKAPDYVLPSNDFVTFEEMKVRLTSSRKAFADVVATLDEEVLNQKSFAHPIFGLMSVRQWIPFVGLHEKRHLAQIEEVKAGL
ncbi:DinB family protein [Bacillus timonensis]|nr:DinB family protein [Bacillus timonensis]